jgi:hypothetical protein
MESVIPFVMLARPNLLSSFPPITYMQPQHYHAIAHSFAQRQPTKPFLIRGLRTLSIATGVAPLLRVARPARQRTTPYGLSPLESAFTPNGLLTPLESAFTKNTGVAGVGTGFRFRTGGRCIRASCASSTASRARLPGPNYRANGGYLFRQALRKAGTTARNSPTARCR